MITELSSSFAAGKISSDSLALSLIDLDAKTQKVVISMATKDKVQRQNIATTLQQLQSGTLLSGIEAMQIVTESSLTEKQQKLVLSQLGLNKATAENTVVNTANLISLIEQLVLKGKLGQKNSKELIGILANIAATKQQTNANYSLSASMKALQASMGVWGWISIAASFLIPVIMELVGGIKSAKEQFQEISDTISQNNTEIDSLNDELKTTQERIAELESMGKLSFTDEAELKQLKSENAELERKIRLLAKENEEKSKEAVKTFKKSYNGFDTEYNWSRTTTDVDNNGNLTAGYITEADYIRETIGLYHELIELEKDVNYKGYTTANGRANGIEENITSEELKKELDGYLKLATEYHDAIDKLYESGYVYGSDAEVDKTIDSMYEIIDLYEASQGETTGLFDSIINRDKYSEARTEIEKLANAGNLTSESLQNLYNQGGNVKEFIDYMLSLNTVDWKTMLGDDFDRIAKSDVDDGIVSTAEALDWMKESGENSAKVMGLFSNELNKVEDAAKGADSAVKSFKNIANEIDTAIDAITHAQTDMSENGYLTVDSIIALEEAGLTDYLKETENGYILANGALETYLDSQGKTYQNAVTDAVKNASKLATQQEAVAAGYENSAKGLLLYLKAQKALAISQIPNDEMRMFNYKKIIEQYDPAINSIETAIKNQEKFDKVIKTKKKENKDKKSNDGSKTNKTAENKIAYYKHQHEMGIISEAAYYKKLEKIRKDYYAGKKDYLNRDRELQEEYHDWEVRNAEDGFDKKVKALQDKYANGKITYAKLKSEIKKLINSTFANDKDTKNKYLKEELPSYLTDAKEQKEEKKTDAFETERSNLKRRLEMGKITEETYYKELKKLRNKYQKSTIKDIKDGVKEINKELHDYDVSVAKETFETKSEDLISDYVAGKFNYAEFKKRYKALIADVKKVDKEEAAQLTEEAPEVYKDAREQRFDASYDKLKYQLENGFISEKTYYQKLDKLYKTYYGDKTKYLDEYAQYSQEVYDGFKDMYKEDLEAQKESLEKQKEEIAEFYDDLIEKKREEHDAEDYKEEQSEKRKTLSEIERQIAELEKDGSEKAKARIAELEEERKAAEKELEDFEKEHAREEEIERIEKEREKREKKVQEEIEKIDKQLEDLNTNTATIRDLIVDYAKKKGVTLSFAHASGTRSSPGGFGRINEKGIEMISAPDGNGNYIPMLPNSYVFSAKATDFLWKLATEHSLPQAMYNSIAKSIKTQSNTPSVNIAQPITITMGDVIIKGNADKQTVADIKKQQENTVRMVLQKIKELQK